MSRQKYLVWKGGVLDLWGISRPVIQDIEHQVCVNAMVHLVVCISIRSLSLFLSERFI
jgi:hypothetical protein